MGEVYVTLTADGVTVGRPVEASRAVALERVEKAAGAVRREVVMGRTTDEVLARVDRSVAAARETIRKSRAWRLEKGMVAPGERTQEDDMDPDDISPESLGRGVDSAAEAEATIARAVAYYKTQGIDDAKAIAAAAQANPVAWQLRGNAVRDGNVGQARGVRKDAPTTPQVPVSDATKALYDLADSIVAKGAGAISPDAALLAAARQRPDLYEQHAASVRSRR